MSASFNDNDKTLDRLCLARAQVWTLYIINATLTGMGRVQTEICGPIHALEKRDRCLV